MLESLLLSRDAEVFRILRPTLEKLSIDVEICQEAKKASEILIAEKYDAVIVDCDDLPGGAEVLEGLRNTPSNKNSVTFAIVNGAKTTTQQAFGMGVNFVLHKPLSVLNASRCFNAAMGYMLRERRRYFRPPIKTLVKILLGEKEINAMSTNVSEGGIAVQLNQALPKSAEVRLQFSIPATKIFVDVEAELAWTDLNGVAGLRFLKPPTSQLLEDWLNEHAEKETPGAKDKMSNLGATKQ
jgi:DNA-binding response OmpR family regulator